MCSGTLSAVSASVASYTSSCLQDCSIQIQSTTCRSWASQDAEGQYCEHIVVPWATTPEVSLSPLGVSRWGPRGCVTHRVVEVLIELEVVAGAASVVEVARAALSAVRDTRAQPRGASRRVGDDLAVAREQLT